MTTEIRNYDIVTALPRLTVSELRQLEQLLLEAKANMSNFTPEDEITVFNTFCEALEMRWQSGEYQRKN